MISEHTRDHVAITPSILYFGTPVVLLSTENETGARSSAYREPQPPGASARPI